MRVLVEARVVDRIVVVECVLRTVAVVYVPVGIATFLTPASACIHRAAMAALLKRQKPMARSLSAWWPGGRIAENTRRCSPNSTAQHESIAPPAATSAASQDPLTIEVSGSA